MTILRRLALMLLAGMILLGMILLGMTGCELRPMHKAASTTTTQPPKLKIFASTMILADFARAVGADRVEVTAAGGPEVSPHDYTLSTDDETARSNAELVVFNGIGLEREGEFSATDYSVDASVGVQPRASDYATDGVQDPHIWMSIVNAKIMVDNIAQGMQRADPSHASDYQLNEQAYTAQLDALDLSIRQSFAGLESKAIVAGHDDLGYFAREYGLQLLGSAVASVDPKGVSTPQQLSDLEAKVRTNHVKAIFTEHAAPTSMSDLMGRQLGVTVLKGEDALYVDTLGPEGSDANTYLKMIHHDVNLIVDQLG